VTLQAVNCASGKIHLSELGNHKLMVAVNQPLNSQTDDPVAANGNLHPWNYVYATQKTFFCEINAFEKSEDALYAGTDISAYLGVPIQAKGNTLGVLSLFGPAGSLSDNNNVQLIESISDQLGLAIESARLRQQAEQAIITEERQRLARDLHDSVSQSLYGLVLAADAGQKYLINKDYQTLNGILEKIKQTSVQSLKEIRLMLHQLRPHSMVSGDLVDALNQRLNTVERRSGIETELHAEGIDHLPLRITQELYLVAMEALNNTLKHSFATQVSITVICNNGNVKMEINDNGCGFDQKCRSNGGIGVESMQERAQALGGTFELISRQNQGTLIRVVIPINLAKPESEYEKYTSYKSVGCG
jgi:signal transduction histidine kinase